MATELKLRNTRLSGLGQNDRTFYDLSTTFGTTAISPSKIVNTQASGTEIQFTDTAGGGFVVEFVSGRTPSGGFTLTTASVSLWLAQSMTTANVKGRVRLFKLAPAGTETELAGGPFDDDIEPGTSLTEMTWTADPTDTAFAENDRLLMKVYITNNGTMAGSLTASLSFDAASGATGDSFISLNETVTFKAEDNFSGHTLILHGDGADASTTVTDSSTRVNTVTAVGNAQLDTAQSKFGTASFLFDGTGDYLRTTFANGDFAFMDGDFTVDCWIRRNTTGEQGIFTTAGSGEAGGIAGLGYAGVFINSSHKLIFDHDAGDRITGTTSITADSTWHHVALTRSGTDDRLFLDGTQEGSTYTISNTLLCATDGMIWGARNFPTTPSAGWNGWIDEIHVERGVAEWTANFTPPTSAWSVSTPLTPSLFTNTNTFPAHAITTTRNISPSLFLDGDTFGAHTVSQVTSLSANTYSDPDTLYPPAITVGAVNLLPALFSDADTFRTHVITTGAVNLTASLYTNTNTFYTHTITATYSLLPSLFTDADTFGTHTITTLTTLSPSLYLNVNVLYPPTISTGGGAQDLTPSLYADPDIFYTHTITTGAVNLAPPLYSDADTFYTHAITTGAVNLAPSLFTNTNTFYSHTITTLTALFPSLYSNTNTFYQHTITTGAVNLAAPLLSDADTFYQHTISQGFLIQPSLFLNTNVFYTHAITTGAVNLVPGLFSDADTFYQHTITTTYALSPSLFTDADTFYTHTITATYNLIVGLFTDADQLYPPTITIAGGTFNLDVPLLENQNQFNQFYQHTLTGGQQGPQEGFGGPGPTAIRFSREDWRRLKKKWEEAARAQEAVERKAKEVTGKRREALAAAARAADNAILEAEEAETPPDGADTLTRLLRAAVAAKSLSDTVTAANAARDYARMIESAMEEEEAVALLMMQ